MSIPELPEGFRNPSPHYRTASPKPQASTATKTTTLHSHMCDEFSVFLFSIVSFTSLGSVLHTSIQPSHLANAQ